MTVVLKENSSFYVQWMNIDDIQCHLPGNTPALFAWVGSKSKCEWLLWVKENLLIYLFLNFRAVRRGCNNAQWPDKYGHYREAKYAQTKHHWFWKVIEENIYLCYFYRPPTKLQEPDVFSRVCLSFCSPGGRGGPHETITHEQLVSHKLHGTRPPPAPALASLPSPYIYTHLAPNMLKSDWMAFEWKAFLV